MPQSPSKPRRRWFQFGLIWLFVFTTLVALWLGWELKFIRERRAFLMRLESQRQAELQRQANLPRSGAGGSSVGLIVATTDEAIPIWRRWL
jgi:hypothetical protein